VKLPLNETRAKARSKKNQNEKTHSKSYVHNFLMSSATSYDNLVVYLVQEHAQ
jgi:hypothetical protein